MVGGVSTVGGVSVSGGYFTTQVNTFGEFGDLAFSGEAHWLEVDVLCTGDAGFTTLSPRQPLAPTPTPSRSSPAHWCRAIAQPPAMA